MSSYRITRRAYPTEYWDAHGEEIIDTANEIHDDKWSFRESRQLISNGLRTRSFEASHLTLDPMGIIIDGSTLVVAAVLGVVVTKSTRSAARRI